MAVVIGAGFAGLQVVLGLKAVDRAVTLIGLCCAIRLTVEVPLSPDKLIPRAQ